MLGFLGRRKRAKPCVHIVIPRWWSKWEIFQQALCYFKDIEPFVQENETTTPAMRPRTGHLLEIFDDLQDAQDLQLLMQVYILLVLPTILKGRHR